MNLKVGIGMFKSHLSLAEHYGLLNNIYGIFKSSLKASKAQLQCY